MLMSADLAAHAAAEYGDDVPETASEEQDKKQQAADTQCTYQHFVWGLEALQPPDQAQCWLCQQTVDISIQCTTCDPRGALLCPGCDEQQHGSAHFHRRKHFLQGYPEPLGPCQFINHEDEQGNPQGPVMHSALLACHDLWACAGE